MWQYRLNRSAMIRFRVTQVGCGARLNSALYHPFIQFQASFWRGGSTPSSFSLTLPYSSAFCCQFPFRLALIAWPRHRRKVWLRRAETLFLMSLHLSSKIQSFFLASCVFGFGVALWRAAKSLSFLVGEVGGQRWRRVLFLRYLLCFLRGVLRRHPRIR